eukprot:CAMPEP_0119464492 /NCGR_PEP_ID=MMETSP1344-20130328/62_2 /TAXON_ID=236787 /ORGANISM="Florenciella parvula, Strain CCMP2471" /LENGTH=224 /DNA_ID=CAMNT_0007496701 /DNA_START=153 /DNA_END=829 /DNA_ORIENTATION=-
MTDDRPTDQLLTHLTLLVLQPTTPVPTLDLTACQPRPVDGKCDFSRAPGANTSHVHDCDACCFDWMYDEGVCNACIAAECNVDDDSGTSGMTDDNGGGGGGGGSGGGGGGAKQGGDGGLIAGLVLSVLFVICMLYMSRNPEARVRAITCLQEVCQATYDGCAAFAHACVAWVRVRGEVGAEAPAALCRPPSRTPSSSAMATEVRRAVPVPVAVVAAVGGRLTST